MKNGKNPTMRQKLLLQSRRLNPANRLVIKDTPMMMEAAHRHGGSIRQITKGGPTHATMPKANPT